MRAHVVYIQKVVGCFHTVKRNRNGKEDDEDEDGDGDRLCVSMDLLFLIRPLPVASI